jgi:hypothetical protein
MAEPSWYESLRAEWASRSCESSAHRGIGTRPRGRRAEYASTLSAHDNLFCGAIHALYDAKDLEPGTEKKPWLERLRADGVLLIDLVPHPINKGKRV